MLAAAVVKVMIVGTFHMANPGHDLHNLQVDDVLSPRRQAEIEAVVSALARFAPTRVSTEWPADAAAERYPKFLDGTLAPSRNEVVQLGFRLAQKASLKTVDGIDADGDFPWEPVQKWAESHGQKALLDEQGQQIEAMIQTSSKLLAEKGIAATLRYINDPARIARDNGFYRTMLRFGPPGVELVTAWYKRNFAICQNLIQLAKPGERVVVFYGFGHAFLLRQCAAETPGFELVEPGEYLPQ